MKCQHRLEIPDFPPIFWREILNFNFGVFLNRQFQRFWRENLNFEFQKRNRRPRINLGWSWSVGGCLCGAHAYYFCKTAHFQLDFPFHYTAVVGSCKGPAHRRKHFDAHSSRLSHAAIRANAPPAGIRKWPPRWGVAFSGLVA